MTAGGRPRPSATVMLVRDAPAGDRSLEVFMLRRHPSTAFGSVHVFPGGVVDGTDNDPGLDGRCPDLTDAEASARLRVPTGGRAFWVAAARECFEEAGVLLARHASGEPLRLDHHPAVQRRFEEHRRAVHAGTRSLLEVLRAEALVLALGEVRYLSRWITPTGQPKRFDARFFVARAPEGHAYAHDDLELIDSGWVRPDEALDRSSRGDFDLIEPTIRSLEDVGRFTSVDELLASAHLTPAPEARPA